MTNVLWVGDPHAHPDFHNKRFGWLGELVVDLKPDVVICAGDWADMPSLCSYDKGTKGYEGRRYKKDIDAAIDALERFEGPLNRAKKKKPRKVMLIGNHEKRISRAVDMDAAHLDGIISQDDLAYEEFGWETVPYNGSTPGIFTLNGCSFSHFYTSGIMNRPISGTHPAYQLLVKQFQSCVQGHAHVLDYCIRTNSQGRHIRGLVGGCYLDYSPDYAGAANDLWWRGVVHMKGLEAGNYEPEFISLDMIKEAYA